MTKAELETELEETKDAWKECEGELKEAQEEIEDHEAKIERLEYAKNEEYEELEAEFDNYGDLPEIKSLGDCDKFQRIMEIYPLITDIMINELISKTNT